MCTGPVFSSCHDSYSLVTMEAARESRSEVDNARPSKRRHLATGERQRAVRAYDRDPSSVMIDPCANTCTCDTAAMSAVDSKRNAKAARLASDANIWVGHATSMYHQHLKNVHQSRQVLISPWPNVYS